jgi:hypothetical protein
MCWVTAGGVMRSLGQRRTRNSESEIEGVRLVLLFNYWCGYPCGRLLRLADEWPVGNRRVST